MPVSSNLWHVRMMGHDIGPMPFADVRALAMNKSLMPTDQVRNTHDGAWLPATDVPRLFDPKTRKIDQHRTPVSDKPESRFVVAANAAPLPAASLEIAERQPATIVDRVDRRSETRVAGDLRTANGTPPGPQHVRDMYSVSNTNGGTEPLSLNVLLQMILHGDLDADDHVRLNDGEWEPARSHKPLMAALLEARKARIAAAETSGQAVPLRRRGIQPTQSTRSVRTRKSKTTATPPAAPLVTNSGKSATLRPSDPVPMLEPLIADAPPVSDPTRAEPNASVRDRTSQRTAPPIPRAAPPPPINSSSPVKTATAIPPHRISDRRVPPRPVQRTPRTSSRLLFNIDTRVAWQLVAGLMLVMAVTVYFAFGSGTDRECFDQLNSLRQEMFMLRDQGAAPDVWAMFKQRAEQTRSSILDRIEDSVTGNLVRRKLLFAARDYLIPMIDDAASTDDVPRVPAGSVESSPETQFNKMLDQAGDMLDGIADTADIDPQSQAPPERD